MRTVLRLAGLIAALTGTGVLMASPAQAADEWTYVGTWGSACSHGDRTVFSSVRGGDAEAAFTICWNSDLTDVRVWASANDNAPDGYHAEARIRYQVWTGSAWSGWHYRAPAAAYGSGAYDEGGPYKANQKTANVQVAACLYDGDTLIDCDDRGWQ